MPAKSKTVTLWEGSCTGIKVQFARSAEGKMFYREQSRLRRGAWSKWGVPSAFRLIADDRMVILPGKAVEGQAVSSKDYRLPRGEAPLAHTRTEREAAEMRHEWAARKAEFRSAIAERDEALAKENTRYTEELARMPWDQMPTGVEALVRDTAVGFHRNHVAGVTKTWTNARHACRQRMLTVLHTIHAD